MKKFLTLALTAVMALSLLTACGSKNDNSANTNTDGSNTETTAVRHCLDRRFHLDGKGHRRPWRILHGHEPGRHHSPITPPAPAPASQAVTEGRCDIGLSSRALKDDEKASGLGPS